MQLFSNTKQLFYAKFLQTRNCVFHFRLAVNDWTVCLWNNKLRHGEEPKLTHQYSAKLCYMISDAVTLWCEIYATVCSAWKRANVRYLIDRLLCEREWDKGTLTLKYSKWSIRIWRTFVIISCFDCIEFGVRFDWCIEICHFHQLYKCERPMHLCFLHLKNYLNIFLCGWESQRILRCFKVIVAFSSK